MEEQPSVGSKDQPDVAKFAAVMGVARTSEKFSVRPEQVKAWIATLVAEELPLFSKLKDGVVDCARRKGLEGAAKHFGLSVDVVDRLVEERRSADGGFEFTTCNKILQTTEDLVDMRKTANVKVQAGVSGETSPVDPEPDEPPPVKFAKDNEERKVQRKYSTQDKVAAVREFVKHSNQSTAAKELNIPTVSLNRWREKIKTAAFQDAHAENLYGGDTKMHKDKFYMDLDMAIHEWYVQNKDQILNVDEEIERKAKSTVKVDDSDPVISQKWLAHFKSHYKITAPAKEEVSS